MGQFFLERFQRQGTIVQVLDKPLIREKMHSSISPADLVLLATPIQACEFILTEIQSFIQNSTILADICSVKSKPLELMLEMHSGPVVGTHPLFGPDPEPGDTLKTAVIPGRDKKAEESVFCLIQSIGLTPFKTSAKEHDQALAFIQGLNFVSTLSYLATTPPEENIKEFITPSFRRRLKAAHKMLTQDFEMFEDMFELNPYSQEIVHKFSSHLNLAAAGELNLLKEKASWWWSEQDKGEGL